MKESDYHNLVFLIETMSTCLERKIKENDPQDEIDAGRRKLAEYRKRLDDAIQNASPHERRMISIDLAKSRRLLG